MINQNWMTKIENTEQQAKRFFENNPSLITPEDLIDKAAQGGLLDDDNIDADLFRHLMKKYHYQGLK